MKSGLRVIVAIFALGAMGAGGYLLAKSTTTTTTTTTSSTTTSTTTTLASTACKSENFTGVLAGGSGAAGTIYTTVTLTNHALACTIDGYGSLQFIYDGTVKSVPVQRSTTYFNGALGSPQQFGPISVAHLGGATFVLSYSNHPGVGQSDCPIVTGLGISLPGETTVGTISISGLGLFAPCSSAPVTYSPFYLASA